MKCLLLLPLAIILTSCAQYGKVKFEESPQVINVSSYDPKERQKSGASYTPLNQAALKKSGALGLIARCGKGTELDTKCSDFMVGAEQQSMLLGTYYFLLPNQNPTRAADIYINRLRQIKQSRGLKTQKVLLAADIHTRCSTPQIIQFLKRIRQRTGVIPLVYLENSDSIRNTLNNSTRKQKSFLRQHPYWLALYSNTHAKYKTPRQLVKGSGVWNEWAMWQYAGVWWKRGRSQPYHYNQGKWKTPRYFGNLSQPTERNGFNGSHKEFYQFWEKHSWAW